MSVVTCRICLMMEKENATEKDNTVTGATNEATDDFPTSFGRKTSIVCDICCVPLTSEGQMKQHLAGKSHAKRVKALQRIQELDGKPEKDRAVVKPNETSSADPVFNAVINNAQGRLPTKRKILEIPCKACGMIFNNHDLAKDHFESEKHAKKIAMVTEIKGGIDKAEYPVVSADDLPAKQPAIATASLSSFYCSFCKKQLNSPQQLTQHREGAAHKANVTAASKIQNNFGKFRPNYKKGRFPCQTCQTFFHNSAELHRHMNSQEHHRKATYVRGYGRPDDSYYNYQSGYNNEEYNQNATYGGWDYNHGDQQQPPPPPPPQQPPRYFSEYDSYSSGYY